MKNCLALVLPLLLFSLSAAAQIETRTAPVVWERYKLADAKVSIELPKMPVRIGSGNACSSFERNSYFSYADEAVYEITVVSKSQIPIPNYCRVRELFSIDLLTARLGELRSGKPEMTETSQMRYDRQTYRFAGESNARADVRWVIPDMDDGRWIEVAIAGRSDKKSSEDAFVKSLDLTGAAGKEVGSGAPATLGDPVQPTEAVQAATPRPADDADAASTDKTPVTQPLHILAKPKARYTDEARRANVQGSIRAKVTLQSNGSVGNITLVTDLPKGLNDQAIYAARRVVFLPARVNGVPISKVVTIEYHFSIY